ncbi:MAG: hypothetical protein JWO81_2640 [Alphaproteobacteria bacterium]|nr:hypothetical protein [Alphaproteobacteria bacterium]
MSEVEKEDPGGPQSLERRVWQAAIAGEAFRPLPDERLPADMLKRLVVGIRPHSVEESPPLGVMIVEAIVEGRLELGGLLAPSGGRFIPMEFRDCRLIGGFSGSHGRFSRLAFDGCTFEDSPSVAGESEPRPTLDLTGTTIAGGLAVTRCRPAGADDHLWIRAPAARVETMLDLSHTLLRSPPDRLAERLWSEPPIAALDLEGAQIGGDLDLSAARIEGRLYGRNVGIRSNLWLSGASLSADAAHALFLPGARIGGLATMDRRADLADSSGPVRQFTCSGELNFRGATIGKDLHLDEASVAGKVDLLDVEVGNDLILSAAVRDGIDITGCRIGGSLDLDGLQVGEKFEKLLLRDGTAGRSLNRGRSTRSFKLVAARHQTLSCIADAQLLETLWEQQLEEPPRTELVQAGFIIQGSKICRLDGFASGLEAAVEAFGHAVADTRTAVEFLKIYAAYAVGEGAFPLVQRAGAEALPPFARIEGPDEPSVAADDFFHVKSRIAPGAYEVEACALYNGQLCRCRFRIAHDGKGLRVERPRRLQEGRSVANAPRFFPPFAWHPHLDKVERNRLLDRPRWVLPAVLDATVSVPDKQLSGLAKKLDRHMWRGVSLDGSIVLSNFSCRVLDDEGGLYWGRNAHIDMLHFNYEQATWFPRREGRHKPSHKRALDLILSWLVSYLWPPALGWFDRRGRWVRSDDFWNPWETRRNWLYQQFVPSAELPCRARYKIDEREYAPQPFEQAIQAARREGHEDFAIEFEVLKHRIEWRLTSWRTRDGLAFLGLAIASFWLYRHHGSLVWTFLAALCSLGLIVFGSPIAATFRRLLPKGWGWLRKPLVQSVYYAPALILYFIDGWYARPLHFVIALIIYLAIRYVVSLSGAFMGLGFGYLRKPSRAIGTFVFAFLVGWGGVHEANSRLHMLVVDAEPVAGAAGAGAQEKGNPNLPIIISAGRVSPSGEMSCLPLVSEPLYALDILIPLLDLREESRCEVKREADESEGLPRARDVHSLSQAVTEIPRRLVHYPGFWAVLKVLYAIGGWLIVTLSILTFAQANRTKTEDGR